MNINNLKENQVIKNYKELCSILEMPVSEGGDDKKNQMLEFSRYCDYEKSGHKIIIKKIYDSPLPKVNMFNKNSKYVEDVAYILVDWLLKADKVDDKHVIHTNIKELIEMLAFANKNFNIFSSNKSEAEEILNMPYEKIDSFLLDTLRYIKDTIDRSLKSLEKKSVLSANTTFFVKEFDSDKFRIASDDEVSKILTIRYDTFKEVGCQDARDLYVFKPYMIDRYNVLLNRKLTRMNIEKYYNGYKIILASDRVLNTELSFIEKRRKSINEKVIKRCSGNNDPKDDDISKLIELTVDINGYDKKLSKKILSVAKENKLNLEGLSKEYDEMILDLEVDKIRNLKR